MRQYELGAAPVVAAAILLAIAAGSCASRPSHAGRTVAAGDRVRVWLEPGATENPLVGDVDSIGPDALAVDGSMLERDQVLAVQAGDRGYRRRSRVGACVFGTGSTLIAGSIAGDDLVSFIVAEASVMLGAALARSCLFPPDYWIEGLLPGWPPFEVAAPLGPDPRPTTRWGAVCEHSLVLGLTLAALALGVDREAGDAGLVLALLGTNALSGWLQEKACPRIDPGELWLEDR